MKINPKYLAYTFAGIILGAWIAHAWISHNAPHGEYVVYTEILGNPVPTAIGTFELKDSVYVDSETGLQINPPDLFKMLKTEQLSFEPITDPQHSELTTLIVEHLSEIIIALGSCVAPIIVSKFVKKK